MQVPGHRPGGGAAGVDAGAAAGRLVAAARPPGHLPHPLPRRAGLLLDLVPLRQHHRHQLPCVRGTGGDIVLGDIQQ